MAIYAKSLCNLNSHLEGGCDGGTLFVVCQCIELDIDHVVFESDSINYLTNREVSKSFIGLFISQILELLPNFVFYSWNHVKHGGKKWWSLSSSYAMQPIVYDIVCWVSHFRDLVNDLATDHLCKLIDNILLFRSILLINNNNFFIHKNVIINFKYFIMKKIS